jgi:hypothetical protein
MTKLKIKVTKDIYQRSMMCGVIPDINAPITENCAVALAIRDIFPNASVTHREIIPFAAVGNYDFGISLPHAARQLIGMFDACKNTPQYRLTLPEIEFEVEIPDEVLEHIDIKEITKILTHHPYLELCA